MAENIDTTFSPHLSVRYPFNLFKWPEAFLFHESELRVLPAHRQTFQGTFSSQTRRKAGLSIIRSFENSMTYGATFALYETPPAQNFHECFQLS
jgi:hypothetical protein